MKSSFSGLSALDSCRFQRDSTSFSRWFRIKGLAISIVSAVIGIVRFFNAQTHDFARKWWFCPKWSQTVFFWQLVADARHFAKFHVNFSRERANFLCRLEIFTVFGQIWGEAVWSSTRREARSTCFSSRVGPWSLFFRFRASPGSLFQARIPLGAQISCLKPSKLPRFGAVRLFLQSCSSASA